MIFNASSKSQAVILASMYPKNKEMIIKIANETGLNVANQALSRMIMKKKKAKIIVNIPTILIFQAILNHSSYGFL